MATIAFVKGKGWIRHLPGFRDNTPGTLDLADNGSIPFPDRNENVDGGDNGQFGLR